MTQVSRRYLAAVNSGTIDPKRRPEEGWAFLLSAMSEEFGSEIARQMLTGFDQMADRRHYSGRALDVLEVATATEAAKDWLRGDVAEAPEKPEGLTQDFDWPLALSVWALVKAGGLLPDAALSGQALTLVLEAHIQRGEIDIALDLAERAGGLRKRVTLARDVMRRQNRLCDQFGILPGQSVLLGGQLLYDFQDR